MTILAELFLPLMLIHLALFALTATRHVDLLYELSAISYQQSAETKRLKLRFFDIFQLLIYE